MCESGGGRVPRAGGEGKGAAVLLMPGTPKQPPAEMFPSLLTLPAPAVALKQAAAEDYSGVLVWEHCWGTGSTRVGVMPVPLITFSLGWLPLLPIFSYTTDFIECPPVLVLCKRINSKSVLTFFSPFMVILKPLPYPCHVRFFFPKLKSCSLFRLHISIRFLLEKSLFFQ